MPDVLVAGIGNIFNRDDGFGCAVAAQLNAAPRPVGTRVVDYGIRGIHLQYDLLDGVAALVLIDAVPPREGARAPGSVVTLEVTADHVDAAVADAHSISPAAVLAGLRAMGGTLPPTFVVGCVPADTGEGIGLTGVVAAAVPSAVDAVLALVARLAPVGG